MEDTPKLSENIIPKNEDNATVVLNKPNEANQKDENDPLYPERSELNEKKHLQITLLRIEKELNDSKKKRINSVYKKYIINEELTNRRVRKTLSRSFLCCAFQIFLPIIEIINLIGIFIVISIMNTMFTLLWNSIKSYSLFNLGGQYNLNFYKELYNDSMNQTIDFNIMFFMNFLGDMMLKSKGFVISSFLFLVINWICFFWVYNFTFKDNKESEPPQEPETYTFFNILFILGFFLLLFVGVGGSSMLSQQILLDSYEKLNIYSRKKSKKEKASLERKEKMKKLEEENKMNDSEYKELLKEDKKAEEEEEDSDVEEESDENDDEEKEEEEDEDDEEEFPKISNNKEEDKDKDKKEEIIPVKEPEEENNNIITNDIKNEKDDIEKKLENIEEVGQEHKEKDSDKDKKEEDKNGDDAKDKDKKKHKKNDLENSKFNYFFLICIITIISYIGKYYFTCILGYRLFKDQTSSSKYLNYFLYLIIIYSACILISIVLYGLFSFIFRTKEKKEVEKKDFYSVFQLLGFTLYKETLSTTNKPKQGGFCLLCESFKDCFNKIVIFPLCNFICCNQLTEESTDNMCTCCCCCCPDYNVEDYHRNNVIFCYCYQERRINKWFHSFLVNKTQKAIIPYMIQYFFLRLFMMGFDKAYDESITEDTGEKSNSFVLFAISFFFFFYITFTFSYFSGKLSKIDENEDKNKEKKEEGKEEEKKEEGKEEEKKEEGKEEEKKEEGKEEEKKEEEKKDEDEKKDVDAWVNMFISGLEYEGTKTGIFSQNILNGTIGIFLVNGLYSLILSSKYLAKSYNSDEELETELGKDNYVIFPVLLNKYYYFTLLYFCLTYSEEQDGFNLISSSTLISLYISAFDFIISIIGVLGTKSVIIIQLVFSCFVGIFWLFIIIAFLVSMIKDKTIKPIIRTLCLFLCRFFIFCLIMAFIDENKKCYCQCCADCCQKISEEDKEVKIIEEDKGEEKEKFIQEDKSNENKDDKEDKEEIIDV